MSNAAANSAQPVVSFVPTPRTPILAPRFHFGNGEFVQTARTNNFRFRESSLRSKETAAATFRNVSQSEWQ